MNYIDQIARRIGNECGMRDADADNMRLLRIYALLALMLGDDTSNEDVHNAWSAWRADTQPDHRSLVPYVCLSPEVQALDSPYAAAIRRVAHEIANPKFWRGE